MAELILKNNKNEELKVDEVEADLLLGGLINFLNGNGKRYTLMEGDFMAMPILEAKISYKKGVMQ